jgi:alkylated DNA repair dioxygenase AlkB
MIEAGLRTRTTRSATEMEKYNVSVGDIIEHVGKSSDGTTKSVLARVTAIYPKGSPQFTATWDKEGWTAEGVKAIERFNDGAAAIEFELISPSPSAPIPSEPKNENAVVTTVSGGSVVTIDNVFTDKQSEDYIGKIEQLLSTEENRVSNRGDESKQVAVAYGPLEYRYSMGRGRTAIHTKKEQPKWMQELSRKVESELGKPSGYYNHVLINRYGDNVGIGTHTDAESIYGDEKGNVGSVAIYSIGHTQNKHKIGGVEFQATHNSIAEMSTGKLSHSVGRAKGTRYSVNFRHIPSSRLESAIEFESFSFVAKNDKGGFYKFKIKGASGEFLIYPDKSGNFEVKNLKTNNIVKATERILKAYRNRLAEENKKNCD